MMKFNKKTVALLVSVTLLLTIVVGSTVAYLVAQTTPVVNTFEPGSVIPQIGETFVNDTKTDVTVTNTGKVKGYFRAVIIVTWQDGNGNVYPVAPVEGTDYTLSLNEINWTKGTDGYYYYNEILEPGATTPNLINSCKPVADKTPAGYGLHVAIAAQGVQAEGLGADVDTAQEAFTAVKTDPTK